MERQSTAIPEGESDAATSTRPSSTTGAYLLIVALAILGAFIWKQRSEGIFACPADGYRADHYLAYCQGAQYADYDHGAFWFALEPEAQRSATEADVLFLGSSRLQFALSTGETKRWFAVSATRYFLMGFSDTENVVFVRPLLKRVRPHAKVYVINVDRFFDTRETPPAAAILRDDNSQERYRQKRFWQMVHKPICSSLPLLCGNHVAFYRARESGAWQLRGSEAFEATPVRNAVKEDALKWKDYITLAEEFVAELPVTRNCVLLTIVPYADTKRAEASAIANALGLELISPELDDLETFDGSHLDPPSAARWSAAFFRAAGPLIHRCLNLGAGVKR